MSTTNQQKTQDKLAQLLAAKAPSYILCLNNGCSRREHCLRWLATAYAPETPLSVRAVNPRNTDVAAGRCPLFRDSKPLRMPLGLTSIYHDMPSRVERSIKNRLIAALGALLRVPRRQASRRPRHRILHPPDRPRQRLGAGTPVQRLHRGLPMVDHRKIPVKFGTLQGFSYLCSVRTIKI